MHKLRPSTVIPGARFVRGDRGEIVYADAAVKERAGSPLSIQKRGDAIQFMPKPTAKVLHFRSAAAKLRALENQRKQCPGVEVKVPDIRYADPKDIVRVPVYAGLSARLANEMRAGIRRRDLRRKHRKAA
jgi:hypothetical protein